MHLLSLYVTPFFSLPLSCFLILIVSYPMLASKPMLVPNYSPSSSRCDHRRWSWSSSLETPRVFYWRYIASYTFDLSSRLSEGSERALCYCYKHLAVDMAPVRMSNYTGRCMRVEPKRSSYWAALPSTGNSEVSIGRHSIAMEMIPPTVIDSVVRQI